MKIDRIFVHRIIPRYICLIGRAVATPVKALLHSELFHGSRPVGRPNLRLKDTCKNALKCGHVLDLWKTVVDNRQEWRRLIRTVCESHDVKG